MYEVVRAFELQSGSYANGKSNSTAHLGSAGAVREIGMAVSYANLTAAI